MAFLSLNARACSSYECFTLGARRLFSKLLKQGYLVERLKSSFRKFYGRRIVRFRTSAFDLIHFERVSASTSSFFAHRLAYSSHASMIMPKFWRHEYETGSPYFGPLLKRSNCTGIAIGNAWRLLVLKVRRDLILDCLLT